MRPSRTAPHVSRDPLTLRFLGETAVTRGGIPAPLPPSKKTRALLAYLAITGRPHSRERLCSLLWDVADDPRGALRWSLTKIRALVDEPGRARILADRQHVRFSPEGAAVDLIAVRGRLKDGLDGIDTSELRRLASEFRGEFLEGLDFDDFHAFQAWCVAERESAREARGAILEALVRRLGADPASAIPYARTLVQVDPLAPAARLELIGLLLRAGHDEEARQHYESGLKLLADLGPGREADLASGWKELCARGREAAGAAVRATSRTEAGAPPRRPQRDLPAVCPLVGRVSELSYLIEAFDDAAGRARERAILVSGEPGIGKSRLLAELAATARRRGCTVLEGRSYEAEHTRPYGPWIDALRRLPAPDSGATSSASLASLVSGSSRGFSPDETREQLYGAVVDFVAAKAAGPCPVLIAFDDVQWCDAASAGLLHHVFRAHRHRRVLIALAARSGELGDNDAACRLLRDLRREGALEEVRLGPLAAPEIACMASCVAPGADAGRVAGQSGGNPLFALELARAALRGRDDLPATLSDLVRDRVARLPAEAAETLRWASILGGSFDAGRLASLAGLDLDRLVRTLRVLEDHALLSAASDACKTDGACTFAHEVVRRVVYADLSEPRRRLMHWKASHILQEAERIEDMGERAAELARHAALGGDDAAAARACVAAGRRCLRVFAATEALAFARRGAHHAEGLPERERVCRQIELAEVNLGARRPDRPEEAARELEGLAQRALDIGAAEHARLAFHLLGWLRWEQGDPSGARRHMLSAEEASRSGDDRERVVAMAEAARCLALLERDLGQAEAMLLEAGALSKRLGHEPMALADAIGMLRLHEGHLDEASERFRKARMLAQREQDAMGEFQALEHLVVLELQRGEARSAAPLARELVALGDRMREGSEAPFARALEALSRYADGDASAAPDLDRAINSLRTADAKQRLAYTLTRAAFIDLTRGDATTARRRCREALDLSLRLQRPTEVALARVALARAASLLGEADEARRQLDDLKGAALAMVSHEARTAIEELAAPARRRARAGGGAHPARRAPRRG